MDREDASQNGLPPLPSKHQQRISECEQILSKESISREQVCKFSFLGVPDKLRPLTWRLLWNYLPYSRRDWTAILDAKRAEYRRFVDELYADPHRHCKDEGSMVADHPLSQAADSEWGKLFADQAILTEIEKDVSRTYPDLHFFQAREGDESLPHNKNYRALKQILFVYARLNPGIRYVQGMNELLAPIYWVFAHDVDGAFQSYAEEDAFFVFTNLMAEFRDLYCVAADNSNFGINQAMSTMDRLLQNKDYDLWAHLDGLKLKPVYYAMRWLTLLLSQDFELPDVLRIWDSLFAQDDPLNFVLHFCCALLINQRDALLAGDFADNLQLLQSYPPTDARVLIKLAQRLQAPATQLGGGPL